ncbi:alpha-mannosidase [Deinococcus yavapaiensis]|uniref:Alpha-mannosidase n=1 Tax=Deinococcus yavapaiensis KR-236 TaxID=694435 RepID=A0A318S6U3_9DEIO|nr:alpha-mannosidase [Deinococcus yavapaiensis]PYE54613.1 alpha-mannosidase [Deinococcus yavapaiensis KR-236]
MTDTRREDHDSTSAAPRAVFHMIGNAHIDPVWLWNWQEGFQEVKATYRSALDRLAQFPEFVFTCSSAGHLAWIEANEPEMFDEIRARVHEGRWVLVGGWWVQPDCNLPSGEGFVRQGLYGQRFFASRFGRTAKVGYNPDSFGHAGTLPQILLKSGLTAYTFMRPGPHEQALPGRLFRWEGPDGSSIPTFRIPYEYCTPGSDLEAHVRKCLTEVESADSRLMVFYGVGNHGGGPTIENLKSLERMQRDESLPHLRFSDPESYFREVQDARMPTWSSELQMHAVGCYAAHSEVKRLNRASELALVRAEKFSAIAHAVARLPYPQADFDRAWKRVLFNHFHDILAGTSLESAYDDARNEYGEALATAQHAVNAAVQRLSWRVSIPHVEGSRPFVVFNPHPWAASVPVEHEAGGLRAGFILRDERGERVASQTIRSEATVNGWRSRIAWTATLPPLGYRVFTAFKEEPETNLRSDASDTHVENDAFRLEIDPETGGIARLLHKASDAEVLFASTSAVVLRDDTDTWSHGVTTYDDVVGRFEGESSRLIEHGEVRTAIRTVSRFGTSTLTQDVRVYEGLPYVEVKVRLDWRERHRMLKLSFPANLHFPEATFEAPYGITSRPTDGREQPGQRWLDVGGVHRSTQAIRGLAVINDAKSSYSVSGSTLNVTVTRSAIYAHHDPYVPTEGGDYRYLDQGEQTFTYWLVPHAGTWRDAGIARLAAELTERPVVIPETYHDGPLPPSASFAEVAPANVAVTALKRAEDDRGTIVRLVELHGTPCTATVNLAFLKRELSVKLGKFEIKTLLIPDEGEPREVSLTELE